MTRSKPIWVAVTSCKYKSNKSFGAFEDCKMQIKSGSSSSNSHDLGTIEVKKKMYEDHVIFNLYLDGVLVKQNIHQRNEYRAGSLIEQITADFVYSKNYESYQKSK